MGALKLEKNYDIKDDVTKAISIFLSKKRKEIIFVLAKQNELTHGELAKAINTSVASLSNILAKFDEFEYELIQSKSAGKFTYYFLTEIGKEYVEICNKMDEEQDNSKIVHHEIKRFLQNGKEALNQYKNLKDDEWAISLDDALCARLDYKKIPNEKSEELVDTLLINIENVLLYDSENFITDIMDLMERERVLRSRLARFIDRFEAFRLLLQVWNAQESILQIYELLEAIIWQNEEKEKALTENICDVEKYNELKNSIRAFIDYGVLKNKEDIYRHWFRYLAGNKVLSAYLTKEIWNSLKEEKKNE